MHIYVVNLTAAVFLLRNDNGFGVDMKLGTDLFGVIWLTQKCWLRAESTHSPTWLRAAEDSRNKHQHPRWQTARSDSCEALECSWSCWGPNTYTVRILGGYFWWSLACISSWGTTVCSSQGEDFSLVSSTGIKLLHAEKAPWCEPKCSNWGQAGDSLQKYHSNLNKNADLAYTGSLNEIQLLKSIVLLGKVTGRKLNTVLWGHIKRSHFRHPRN